MTSSLLSYNHGSAPALYSNFQVTKFIFVSLSLPFVHYTEFSQQEQFHLFVAIGNPAAQYGKQPNSQSLSTMTSTSSSMTSSLPESDSELRCFL